jgi:hypothetical protein
MWGTIRNLASREHTLFFLSAVDMRRQSDGQVVQW